MTVFFIVAGWIVCGIVAAGWFYSNIRGEYGEIDSKRVDAGSSLAICIVGGPISLFVSFFATGFGESGWWRNHD
jgi:hypothetical protein